MILLALRLSIEVVKRPFACHDFIYKQEGGSENGRDAALHSRNGTGYVVYT